MKRTLFVAAITLLLAFGAIMVDQSMSAEKPKGSDIKNSVTSTSTIDSTVAVQRDTTSTPSGSATKLMWFTDVQHYGTISGWLLSEYTALDSGAAAADIPDTAKDTVINVLFTCDADGTPYKEIWRDTSVNFHTTANVANGDYVEFNVSDSTQWSNLYLQIITSIQDSTYVKARTPTAEIKWKHSWHVYAK